MNLFFMMMLENFNWFMLFFHFQLLNFCFSAFVVVYTHILNNVSNRENNILNDPFNVKNTVFNKKTLFQINFNLI